jgi:hypothetical protein
MEELVSDLIEEIDKRDNEIERLRNALESIKLWCQTSTCEICGIKKMIDTDCYDYVMRVI